MSSIDRLDDRLWLLDLFCQSMFQALAEADPSLMRKVVANLQAEAETHKEELNNKAAAEKIEGFIVRVEGMIG